MQPVAQRRAQNFGSDNKHSRNQFRILNCRGVSLANLPGRADPRSPSQIIPHARFEHGERSSPERSVRVVKRVVNGGEATSASVVASMRVIHLLRAVGRGSRQQLCVVASIRAESPRFQSLHSF
jgi:hypothetical protein